MVVEKEKKYRDEEEEEEEDVAEGCMIKGRQNIMYKIL